MLVTIANGHISEKQVIKLTENDADSFANLMKKLKVDVLICNGLPDAYGYLLDKKNITIIQWKYGPVDEILTWFLYNYRQNQ